MKKTRIYMGIPSMGTRSDFQTYAMRQFERDYKDSIELVYPEACVHRMFHDFARNAIVEEFLKSDCDILWFLDSDVVPSPDVLDLVTKHGHLWELAGATYPVFMTPRQEEGPQVVFCVYQRDENGRLFAANAPTSGAGFVDGLATGCMFIRREVLEKMQKPCFEFKYRAEDRLMEEGEDLGFCRKVNELGYQFFTDFSMACAHYKNINLLEVSNYARQFAKNSVAQYDAQIRPGVEELAAKYKALVAQTRGKTASGLILPK
jgi:hypothetical protein